MVKDRNRFLLELTTKIISEYVSNHNISKAQLLELLDIVYFKLDSLQEDASAEKEKLVPAVPREESILEDALICLEDGKKFKLLKRHLSTNYKLSPEEYRSKWGLPNDYPMVAPSYSKKRSKLAKSTGLGTSK